jgi:hypothetical protein
MVGAALHSYQSMAVDDARKLQVAKRPQQTIVL